MNLGNSIFNRDLNRLARSTDAPRLVGRQNTDPDFQAEANYFLAHGETRAQAMERKAAHRREDFEAQAVADLNGAPPELTNTRGLGPKRAALANFFEWQHVEAKRLDDLRARKVELEAMAAAPAATEEKIRDAVRKTAAAMVGRANGSEDVNRGALDAQLSNERHRAEAAQVALAEIDRQIETAELRVARLAEREADFIGPALIEAADEIGIGELYVKKIAELRAIADLIYGLASAAGGYGSGFDSRTEIRFPKTGLPSLSKSEKADYFIAASGNAGVWHQLARAWRMNPRTDAAKFISVPK